jgi:predicted nucleic acid binding AN1-type Zn finger protein
MAKKCYFLECKNKILSMAIDCEKCKNFYCAFHRLPEKHECKFMQEIKEDAKKDNTKALMDNKCVINQI